MRWMIRRCATSAAKIIGLVGKTAERCSPIDVASNLSALRSALDGLHGRNRPSAVMSPDRDAKPVHIVEEDVVDRASLAVGQDDGPPDQLLPGSVQFAKDVRCSLVAGARTAHDSSPVSCNF